ncbi:insulinase family protein [Chloroflexi bacterium TSY]|nr:insulinase family protein [Chloroflexi bacterium TSY]
MTTTHGFRLVQEEQIAELNALVQLYHHEKTGARLLSIQNDDENKVFGINFRTVPSDSTGIAHIMEHAVLGGSRKYPVKEPFVELVKGSLKTFVNAMTGPDVTLYPVASTNTQDFYNLIDVYLDAVFYPLLTLHHLEQEGWHYELEKMDEPLTYKGVVFNEMKGAYSSPDMLLYRHARQSLFPDNTYGLDSGGDPKVIPDLTYEQFKEFHQTYYHPSNAYLFFYGDDDPAERLRLLDVYLRDFDAIQIDSAIPLQQPFRDPKRFEIPYGVDPSENGSSKAYLRLNWMLPEQDDGAWVMAMVILSYALLGTPASPLRKTLIDSGLGEDIVGGGYNSGTRQPTFSVGMKGVVVDNVDRVETLIIESLSQLAKEGVALETLEAAVNSIEFYLRENNTGSTPRGLVIMYWVLDSWIYDRDPLKALAYAGPLAKVKARVLNEPDYVGSLIQEYILNNSHRTTVVLQPDEELRQRDEAEEKQRLAIARSTMDEQMLESLIKNTQELKRRQATPDRPEDLAKIPRLTLADLDQTGKEIPSEVTEVGGCQVLYHDLFTNGIIYLDIGFKMHVLPPKLLPYINLFGRALTEMGTETEDFVQLAQRIGRKTGGVWATNFTSSKRGEVGLDADEHVAWFFLHGKAVPEQAHELLNIMQDVLLTVNLDNQERFRQLVLEAKARKEAGLIPGGMGIVSGRLSANLTTAGWLSEQRGGLEYLFFLRQLAEKVESDWQSVLADLEQIRSLLINSNTLIGNVALDADNWSRFQPQLAEFITALPAQPVNLHTWHATLNPVHEGLTAPAQVNYVGKAARLYDLGYQLHGSIWPITNYLRTTWLWDKVRIQGGAYGARCQFNRRSGILTYLSYRDPNLLETIDVYDQTAHFLRNLELSQDELTKSIIGAISSIDSYQLPDAKGSTSLMRHLFAEDAASRQKIREEVLNTSQADFKAFADVLDHVKERGAVAVLGSQDAIEQVNRERDGWLRVTKVL